MVCFSFCLICKDCYVVLIRKYLLIFLLTNVFLRLLCNIFNFFMENGSQNSWFTNAHSLRTRAQSEHFEHSNRYRVDSYFIVVVVATTTKGLRLIYLTSKWAETLFLLWHYKIINSNVLQSSDTKIRVFKGCSKGFGDESLGDKHVTKHPIVTMIVLANFLMSYCSGL